MSFQNKGLWIAKDSGHVTERDAVFDKPSGVDAKRSHQWFDYAAESEIIPNKKQALQSPDIKSASEFPPVNISSLESSLGHQSFQNQPIGHLHGSDTSRSAGFAERNISPNAGDETTLRRKGIIEEYREDASFSLSISHPTEDPQSCLSYNEIKKVKVSQVKDHVNSIHTVKCHSSNRESNCDISLGQAYIAEHATNLFTMGQAYDKDIIDVMGQTYKGDDHIRMATSTLGKGDDIAVSVSDTYGKGDTTIISFSNFPDDHDIVPVGRSIDSYDQSYNQSAQTLELSAGKDLHVSNAFTAATSSRLANVRPEPVFKDKLESKSSRKEAPNSFPSNVRSLISTGMLDGVTVKYVSLGREKELSGVVRGSGYLCGCQECNYSKVLNAYEFECHANCRTKHPNNHIYFDNGKTIYQIVQELRSTPESLLFDAIQNAFGSPINQKAFRIWKESFQAATRELQRIYGKEELNL